MVTNNHHLSPIMPPKSATPSTQFKVIKVNVPATYLVRRRHSVVPEAVIWEDNGEDKSKAAVAEIKPRRSCHFMAHQPQLVQSLPQHNNKRSMLDLVKTHLIYAVRDEIELLRSRIVELESTVFHLESENATLREHIPKEVLADISFDNIQQQQQFNNKQKVLFSINNISTNK
uniref:Uncharacterized protein n=1 Tax=Meloidogyne hapla TaxID=6305 RepID=A0A1I8BLN9_MELHA